MSDTDEYHMCSTKAEDQSIYASLSREAEALKLRTEATEDCMETLKNKISSSSIDAPVAPPRRSIISLTDIPEISPSAPALSSQSCEDTLTSRLAEVEQMNKDWVLYNENREIFVQQLTAKHHETTNQLRRATEEIQRLQQRPPALSDEQRRQYDTTLIQARNELQKSEDTNEKLTVDMNALESKYHAEHDQRKNAEHQVHQLQIKIENLEAMNNKLVKTIQKDRRKSDLNSSRIEESLNNLSNQLVSLSTSATDRSSNRSSPRKYKAPPRPEKMPDSPVRRNIMSEYSSTSPKCIISPISPSSAKSRRSVDTTAISCENCGKCWPVSQHNLLLKHLDECDVI